MKGTYKAPDMWPFSFHDAMEVALREGQANVGFHEKYKDAQRSCERMRKLWKRLPDTPLHKSAIVLAQAKFKNQLLPAPDGFWEHRIIRVEAEVVLPVY